MAGMIGNWLAQRLAAGVLVVVVFSACAGGGEGVSGTRSLRVGLAYGNTLIGMSDQGLAAALEDAVALGVGTVRADLDWGEVQPASSDQWEWGRFDRVVRAVRDRRLRLLVVLTATPPWARRDGCVRQWCPPADPARFADFATAAAGRYASQGVVAWEIWNEPNTPGFWVPKVDPDGYADLLAQTSKAIRRVDPSAVILLGGLAAVDTTAGSVSAADFLARVCQRGGDTAVNGVAYHPYTYPYLASESLTGPSPWSRIDRDPDSLHSVLTRCGSPDLSIWLTEYGAPTGGPGSASDGTPETTSTASTHVTERRQAEIAHDVVRTAAEDRNIAALIWYSGQDLGDDYRTNLNFYGLRRSDGAQKPAFSAFKHAVTEFCAHDRDETALRRRSGTHCLRARLGATRGGSPGCLG